MLKEQLNLPEGQRERRPRAKEHPELPEGGRAKEGFVKPMIDLPQGQREKQAQLRDFPDLPEGGRERKVQLKDFPELPQGNRQAQPELRDLPELPQGNRESTGPDLKDSIELPQQDASEILTGGIRGLVLPLNPVTRQLGFLSYVKNMTRADKTAAETRPGRVMVGTSRGATRITGLVPFYYGDAKTGVHENKKLITGVGSQWHVWDGSWATLKTGLSDNRKFEGAMMDDHLYLTNGIDPVQVYDGTTIENLEGDPPESPFIAQGYRRLFLVNLPHQVVVCNPADPTNWTTEDSASLTISGKDGDIITWIQFYGTNLYIWKRHGLFELHGPAKGHVTKNWRDFRTHKVGTPNGRTVANVAGTLFWLSDSDNSTGIVAWGGGGYPEVVSDPIKGIIDRINWGIISCAAAGTDGHGNYLLSVPLDNATTPSHTIVFNTQDASWWIWEGWTPSVYGMYRLHGYEESSIMGDYNGTVYEIGGDDDAGNAIPWEMIVGPAVLGSATQEKRVRRAYTIASGAAEQKINAAASPSDSGDFGDPFEIEFANTQVARIKKYLPLNTGEDMGGYLYRLKLSGTGRNKIYEVGFEVGTRRV